MTNKIAYKDIFRHGLIILLFIFLSENIIHCFVKVTKSQKKSLILFTCPQNEHNCMFCEVYVFTMKTLW